MEIYKSLSVLQKFERFFEKMPHESSIAFIINKMDAPFVPLFVKALLRYLGRKAPIMAVVDGNISWYRFKSWITGIKYDQDIIETWLSNNEPRRDLIAHSSSLYNMKAEFIINLSDYFNNYTNEQMFATRNATSGYSHIRLPSPFLDELQAMKFLSSKINQTSDRVYPIHRNNMEKYLRRTSAMSY